MKIAIISACTFALLVGSTSAEELGVEQILARHRETLQRLTHCAVKAREEWYVTRADGSPRQLVSTRNCDIRIDGDRKNLLVDEVSFPPKRSPDAPNRSPDANEFNYVCNGQALEIYYPHDTFDVRPGAPKGVSARLSPQKEDDFFIQNTMGRAALAFGVTTFPGTIPLYELISLCKNDPPVKDEIGYLVAGAAPDGTRHKIWFDPDASFVIRRLIFEQSGETLSDNRYQYNRRVLTTRYGFAEKAVVNSVVLEINNVTVVPRQDSHVITGLEATKTTFASDGTKAVEQTIHTLTDWDLAPDFSAPSSFQPRLPIPEGYRVLVNDTPSLEYIYADSKVQLAVHENTLKQLETVQLPQRLGRPRVQWGWAAVTAMLALIWWKLRSRDG